MQLYGCEQDFFCQIRIIFLSDTVTKPIFHAGTVVFSGDHGSKRHFLPQNRSLETDFTVPHSVRAKETSAEGKSIFAHDPGGKVAEGYRNLT